MICRPMIQTGNWSQQVNDTNAITRIGTFFLAWGSHAHAEVKVSVLEFSNLSNWAAICAVGQHTTDADTFFEAFFKPIKIETTDPSLLTGYFEPELQVSRTKTGRFVYPIYQKPPELPKRGRWLTRAEIEDSKVMENCGLEIAWLDDPVDLFFLQVQGSGRLRIQDGTIVRVGYAAKNGHKYRSVGKELVAQGVYNEHQISASVIKNWVKRNPVDGRKLPQHNDSYVFFCEISNILNHCGPKAGKDAGRIKNSGSLYVLLPIKRALALSRG